MILPVDFELKRGIVSQGISRDDSQRQFDRITRPDEQPAVKIQRDGIVGNRRLTFNPAVAAIQTCVGYAFSPCRRADRTSVAHHYPLHPRGKSVRIGNVPYREFQRLHRVPAYGRDVSTLDLGIGDSYFSVRRLNAFVRRRYAYVVNGQVLCRRRRVNEQQSEKRSVGKLRIRHASTEERYTGEIRAKPHGPITVLVASDFHGTRSRGTRRSPPIEISLEYFTENAGGNPIQTQLMVGRRSHVYSNGITVKLGDIVGSENHSPFVSGRGIATVPEQKLPRDVVILELHVVNRNKYGINGTTGAVVLQGKVSR